MRDNQLPAKNLSTRQVSNCERTRKDARSTTALHTYMGIELHKVDTERESERELALDWIRSQRGEKQGQRAER